MDKDDNVSYMGHILIAHNLNFKISNNNWVFDTGTANSITANKNSLTNYIELTIPI